MTVNTLWTGFVFLVSVYVIRRTLYLVSKLKETLGVPRCYCLIEPISGLSNMLPQTAWNPTMGHLWTWRTRYKRYNSEALVMIPLLYGEVTLYCASPEGLKQILNGPMKWQKPTRALALRKVMGASVIATNGELWRKHRKVTAPAFGNQFYQDVWSVTSRMYKEMLDSDSWKSGDQHYFKSFNIFTTRMALLAITSCGFNMEVPWEGSLRKEGLVDSVDSTIVTVAESLLPRLIFPKWMYKLPITSIRQIDRSFTDLQNFLKDEVASKKAELAEQKSSGALDMQNKNLFSRVVMSSLQEGSKGLSDAEIIGNLFTYLFAGHESTASAMVITLALLALNQQEQDRIHKYIMSTVGLRDLNYEDYNELTPVLHCLHEALRLYPPAPLGLRLSDEETSITAPGIIPGNDTLPIPRNTQFILDFIATGLNTRIFDEPSHFRPLRWSAGDISADDLFAFGYGPRGCLGRKFSMVEAVCFLTHLLRDWQFDIKLENNETRSEWQERIMRPKLEVTMRIDDIPLLVKRR